MCFIHPFANFRVQCIWLNKQGISYINERYNNYYYKFFEIIDKCVDKVINVVT